ncbi:hypothetical protein ACLKA7_013119 [Drosophila subpalustris]
MGVLGSERNYPSRICFGFDFGILPSMLMCLSIFYSYPALLQHGVVCGVAWSIGQLVAPSVAGLPSHEQETRLAK